MIHANGILSQFKRWIFATDVPEKYKVALHGKASCLIARLVFDLPRDIDAESCTGVCHLVANEAIELTSKKATNQWKKDGDKNDKKSGGDATAASSSKKLIEYNDKGEPEALNQLLIENQGFVSGARVQIKEGKEDAGNCNHVIRGNRASMV